MLRFDWQLQVCLLCKGIENLDSESVRFRDLSDAQFSLREWHCCRVDRILFGSPNDLLGRAMYNEGDLL